jgi:hypothetical protein
VTAQVVLTLKAGSGVRTFPCIGDQPNTYSEFKGEFTETTANWFGGLSYDANGFPVYKIMYQDPENDYVEYPRTVVTFKEFLEVPSATPGALSSARYKVMSDDIGPPFLPFSYIERTETTGGVAPTSCGGKQSVSVPYNAVYKFYTCRQDAPKPAPQPAPSPPADEPTAAPTPSPQLSPSPAAAEPTAAPSPDPATPSPSPSLGPLPVAPSPDPATPSPSPSLGPLPVAPSPPSPAVAPSAAPPARSLAAAALAAAALLAALL